MRRKTLRDYAPDFERMHWENRNGELDQKELRRLVDEILAGWTPNGLKTVEDLAWKRFRRKLAAQGSSAGS
jgi:predicted RNase H-like nuclease